jgi:hypothetical protein
MKYVADEVTLGQVFFRVISLSTVRIIPPILHTHTFKPKKDEVGLENFNPVNVLM